MGLSRTNACILTLAVLAGGLGGWWQWRAQHPSSAGSGDMLPDLVLSTLDGQSRALAAYRGRPLLINLWASWCAPCVAELPTLDRARADAPGITVLGIAMDAPARVCGFLDAHPVGYPILLGTLGDGSTPATDRQLGDRDELLPYSLLVDPNGRIRASHLGPLPPALLAQWLREVSPRSVRRGTASARLLRQTSPNGDELDNIAATAQTCRSRGQRRCRRGENSGPARTQP